MSFSSKKILVLVLVLNITALSFYFYLFSNIKNKNEAISISKNILGGQTNKEAELKLVGVSLKETEEKRVLLNSFFVQKGKGGIANFVEKIEDIANSAGVSLSVNSILLEKRNDLDAIENINLGLKVKGSWYKTIYFLGLLESLPYKISFKRIYIEKNEDNSIWNGIFNISILKLSDN